MDSGVLGFICVFEVLVVNYKHLIKKIGGGHDLKVYAPV
jgi:hypothetical protein